MTLQTELETFKAGWEQRVGTANAALIADDIEVLRGSGFLAQVARPGDRWPTPTLIDAHGQPFDLARLTGRPLVVTFYRGGWCPYCNMELRAYQARLADFGATGATLVAISPEAPDHSLSTAEKNDLAFPVLSDPGGQLAEALGIRFTLSDAVRPYYEKAGLDIPARNGTGTWDLPVPATFVVAADGTIAAAFVEPDYRKRTDPALALDALRQLGRDAA
jgi:peroxiredoxin